VRAAFAFSALGAVVALSLTGGGSQESRRSSASTGVARAADARAAAFELGSRRMPSPSKRIPSRSATARPHATASRCHNAPAPVPEHPIGHREWLNGVTITEYYPAPERWFVGRVERRFVSARWRHSVSGCGWRTTERPKGLGGGSFASRLLSRPPLRGSLRSALSGRPLTARFASLVGWGRLRVPRDRVAVSPGLGWRSRAGRGARR
jgi:hypothetical protein